MLDLGAGKFHRSGLLTTNGGPLGTVPYMAPEQMSSESTLDARSDLFSLGLVLVELISGVHPLAPKGFENENVFTFVRKIVAGPPLALRDLAPWVPGHIAEVLDKAVLRDRELRYKSAAEFGAALTAALQRLEREVGAGEPLGTLVAELSRLDGGAAPAANPFAATATAPLAATEDDETLVMARAPDARGDSHLDIERVVSMRRSELVATRCTPELAAKLDALAAAPGAPVNASVSVSFGKVAGAPLFAL